MTGKIRRVVSYKLYGDEYYDVVYKSGVIRSYSEERLTKTAKAFMKTATASHKHSLVFNRDELVYEEMYKDTKTGKIYTEEDLEALFEQYLWEMTKHYDTFDDYIDDMIRKCNLERVD